MSTRLLLMTRTARASIAGSQIAFSKSKVQSLSTREIHSTMAAIQQASSPPQNRQTALIEKARSAASIDPYELSCLIHGGKENLAMRRRAFERFESQTGTSDTSKLPYYYANLNREEAYDEGLKWGRVAFEDGPEHGHDFFDKITPQFILVNASPFGLHRLMFEPAIEHSGSVEQKAKWLPLCRAGNILGTYCQTELGHGTNVQGVETTATWDPRTDEFVLHSPSIASTKFWPGGLGFSTTHALVMARLIINQKDHGPHLFMVQVRSVENGKPIAGIKLGDIGLKLSYNEVDNGFAQFDQVRIPRTNMLMGHAYVSRDGQYSASADQAKLSYATMLSVRVLLPRIVTFQLAQATTIATRYSTVREQGKMTFSNSNTETTLMRFKSQHFRLLTLIAKSYAMLFASQQLDVEYMRLRKLQRKGYHAELPRLHALSAGLKAWTTQEAADGAEDARKCCGGQGYTMMSGLGDLVAALKAAPTFEGENYVMWQQVGRHLLKSVDQLKAGKSLDPELMYLEMSSEGMSWPDAPCKASGRQFLDLAVFLAIYAHRARRLIFKMHSNIRSSEKPLSGTWNEHMMLVISAARAHLSYLVLTAFRARLTSLPPTTSPALKTLLTRLEALFALSSIINPQTIDAISFIEDGHLSATQLDTIRDLVNELLEQILPDAVALTDAWDFSDASLRSALGMYNGNAYENVMRWVEQLPINQRAWGDHGGVYQPGWKESIDPVLKAKL